MQKKSYIKRTISPPSVEATIQVIAGLERNYEYNPEHQIDAREEMIVICSLCTILEISLKLFHKHVERLPVIQSCMCKAFPEYIDKG